MSKLSMISAAILALSAVATNASAADKPPKQLLKLVAMTPEDWVSKTRLQDDSLETSARFDTQLGFQEKHGLLGIVWSDVFLRAYVDKKSGDTQYQVYFATATQGGAWPFFNTVNYEMPGGAQSASLTKVGSDVDCTASRYTGCTYFEHVVFSPGRDVFNQVAALYVPNAMIGWKMRLKGQSGQSQDVVVTPAEVKGLLMAVDAYKTQHGLPR